MEPTTERDEIELKPIVFIPIALIIILSVIPFIRNYKYNDNHLNWANHDYGKNLMMSTEQNSIFMTEGGDNQVFGSLYFIYSEKLRPDLSPYDQKGNIFKRIYGDMRYIDPQTLERRMDMVDSHLFMGEEPFYVNIRDRADPYFIPYWQGQRPVYLTWQRPNQWTLGDYYYKRYGIMYKVQNIEYYLVDYLELKKEISVDEARSLLSASLNRPVDTGFAISKINKMVREGYLQLNGNRVRYVKMYPAPHKGDYLEKLLLRWKDIPNAKYWDFLTREIFINYDYQMGEIYREKIGELQVLKARETRPNIIAEIDKRIAENWKLAKERYKDAVENGGDSLSILHNLAVVYLKNGIEEMDSQAHDLLQAALKYYRNSWSTYSLMFTYLINDILKNPAHETANLSEAEKWMAQLKKEISFYRASRGNYQNHPVWKNFAGIENFLNIFRQVPMAQLQAMQTELTEQIKKAPANLNVNLAEQVISLLYNLGLPFQYQPYIQKANELFDQVIKVKGNDPAFMGWAFNISLQLQKLPKAYQLGKQYESLSPVISDPSFYYTMGMISYNITNRSDARRYLNKFLTAVQDDRKAIIQLRDPIEQARKTLEALK